MVCSFNYMIKIYVSKPKNYDAKLEPYTVGIFVASQTFDNSYIEVSLT